MTNSYIPDYPRPQFVRPDWESLNGAWTFAFDDKNRGEAEGWFDQFPAGQSITVPFSYESPASGIGDEAFHPVVWYRRAFSPRRESGKRVCLHFEGSDYITKVWVNGRCAGCHTGGYTRFTFDITDLLAEGENTLTVRVEDTNVLEQPRGKQRWKKQNFGCWYIQTTGIWKTVWLEYRPETHLEKVKMTPVLSEQALDLEWKVAAAEYGPDLTLKAEISFAGIIVNSAVLPVLAPRGRARLDVFSVDAFEWGIKTWSPEHPDLYDIKFTLKQGDSTTDEVGSYFGMRDIRIEKGNVLLNGVPLYQRLILDQGYWKDSHLTPPDEAALIEDIDKVMELGYNGVRKHQKIEDCRFAYWCDVKGLLLWCEMPYAYQFGDNTVAAFTEQWLEVVDQHYNHPSIITWTPFNESWGVPNIKTNREQQRFTEGIYHLTKSIDAMRPVIVNDGWEHTISDIITLHDYEENGALFFERYSKYHAEIMDCRVYHSGFKSAMAEGYEYSGQPVLISEYGGAAFSGGEAGAWGYGDTVETEEAFIRRIDDMTTAIKELPYACGFCYTQVTDVQQEINGLMDIDRNFKADVKAIREINMRSIGNCRTTYK